MAEDLFRIVYCSRNMLEDGDEAALQQILATSRRNNAGSDVTGALLHSLGLFVQTLEGPFTAVQSVFERIQIDARHDEVVVLEARAVQARLFANWSMAAAEPDDPAAAHRLIHRTLVDPGDNEAQSLLTLLQQVITYIPA